MAEFTPGADRLATVFGGSGFIGRHIVRALARDGWRIRVAVRRPDLAGFLRPLGVVGQVELVQANLRYPESIAAALEGANAVVNAAGIQRQSGRQTYDAVHSAGARAIAEATTAAGIKTLVHVSGLGADARSPNAYIASKGLGEDAVREAVPAAVILRPSVVFGPEDDFLNRFGALARILPALPLFGGGATKLQPVFVGDVAQAALAAISDADAAGRVYELGGPEVLTLREIAALTLRIVERRRALAPLPFGLAKLIAGSTEIASALTFGKFPPKALKTTRDQVELLRHDNIVSAAALADGRTLRGLGVSAQGIEAVAPTYLYRFRKTGQYAARRLA
jgi:uncharacterized protein YbjT (DUF2867 family)